MQTNTNLLAHRQPLSTTRPAPQATSAGTLSEAEIRKIVSEILG